MEAKLNQVRLGEAMCSKLRRICHGDKSWGDVWQDVSIKFTILKEKSKIYYPDKDLDSILKELIRWPDEDIVQLIS